MREKINEILTKNYENVFQQSAFFPFILIIFDELLDIRNEILHNDVYLFIPKSRKMIIEKRDIFGV